MPASEPRSSAKRAPADDGPAPVTHSFLVSLLLAFAQAVLLGVAFAPLNLWPAAVVATLPLIWLALHARSTRRAMLVTFLAQVVLWLWVNRWMTNVTAIGYPLLAGYLAIYTVAFVGILRLVRNHPRFRNWPLALIVPVAWVGVECFRGEIAFTGYPWYLLGHPLAEWPVAIQSADLLGTYVLSFLLAAIAGAIADGLLLRRSPVNRRPRVVAIAVVIGLVVLNLGYGAWRLGQETTRPGPTIVAVQTNLPQDNKLGWSAEAQVRDVGDFIELTRKAVRAAGDDVDLIIWPETMLPGCGLEPETIELIKQFGPQAEVLYSLGDQVVALQREMGIPMLVGSPAWVGATIEPVTAEDGTTRHRLERDLIYNSAYLIDGDPPFQRYDKVLLTPFGEVLPYLSKWPWLEERLLGLGAPGISFSLDSNPDVVRPTLDWDGRPLVLATPICFEDAVPRVCRRLVHSGGRKNAEVLLNLSNDGWFGTNVAGRIHHAQLARFRCVENRVPMIRSANTGVTVAIDSCGRIVGRAGGGEHGYGEARTASWMVATIALDDRSTLYGRIGEVFPFACLAGCAILAAAGLMRRRSKETA